VKPFDASTSPAGEPEPVAPVLSTRRARDDLADELRGFALLGIVTVNAPFIAISAGGFTDASVASAGDRAAAFAVLAFAQAKFYLLFSLLFGYSMSYVLKDDSAEQRRAFRRRLFGLAALGLIHGALFFAFDVLLLYAAMGCVLLALAGRSDRAVLWAAAASGVLWVSSLLVLGGSGSDSAQTQRELQAYFDAVDAVLRSGSFWQAARARMEFWPVAQIVILLLNGFAVLSLFCLGLVAGRAQVLRRPERYTRFWRSGLWLGLVIGLPGALLSATGMAGPGASFDANGAREMAALAIGFATAPALSVAYVAALALLHIPRPGLLRIFRPAGRMSLTGYVGESVLLALIFCGFGLGLMGQLGAGAVTVIALAVWLLLDVFAQLWQKRFEHGPLESLLRRWSWRVRDLQAHQGVRHRAD
jgi:uncharacterized protein